MTASHRPLRQRPFIEADIGGKLHGWRQDGLFDREGNRIHGFVNPMGYGLVHVVNQKAADGRWVDQYDQFALFENPGAIVVCTDARSEEHTSELQSQSNLVCRLLLEKKKKKP